MPNFFTCQHSGKELFILGNKKKNSSNIFQFLMKEFLPGRKTHWVTNHRGTEASSSCRNKNHACYSLWHTIFTVLNTSDIHKASYFLLELLCNCSVEKNVWATQTLLSQIISGHHFTSSKFYDIYLISYSRNLQVGVWAAGGLL